MQYLFFSGAGIALAIIIGLIGTIISCFFGNIIFFDSILLALISGIVCNKLWNIHPAICLVIGLVLFLGLFFLQYTSVGFWIIGVILSALWAFVFGFLAYLFSDDVIWFFVIIGLAFIIMMSLHLKAKMDLDIL